MERISIWNPRWLGSKLASRPITATRLTEDNLWSASRLDQTFPGSLTRLLYVETISSKGMTRAVSGEESAAAFVPPLSAAFLIWKINSLNMYKCIQQVNVRVGRMGWWNPVARLWWLMVRSVWVATMQWFPNILRWERWAGGILLQGCCVLGPGQHGRPERKDFQAFCGGKDGLVESSGRVVAA